MIGLPLFERTVEQNPGRLDLEREASAWVRANPDDYARLGRIARRMRKVRPHARLSIAFVFEYARFFHGGTGTGEAPSGVGDRRFILNNNWRAAVSIMLERDWPELRGAFVHRRRRVENV